MRCAFTLPEVLVAIIILAIGILGLASSGSFIVLQAGEARALSEGAALAGRVLDSLRSVPCAGVTSGQVSQKGRTVRWTAVPATRSISVDVSLDIPRRSGIRQVPISALLPCER